MPRKPPAERGGKTPPPPHIQKEPSHTGGQASPAGLVADATPGNRRAVGLAYGHVAAWLRAGRAPPPELAEWASDRLMEVAAVLLGSRNKKPADAAYAALAASEKGKRGAKVRSRLKESQRRDLIRDVAYQRARWNCTLEEAYDRVVAVHALARHYITPAQVESAWKARKVLIPEMNP